MFIVKESGFSLLEMIVALGISSLVCVSMFDCIASIEVLRNRQLAIFEFQKKTRFLSLFFREKIQSAGDWSCEPDKRAQNVAVINRYTAAEAREKLGLTIKPETDLLQLKECVRMNHKLQYLPINFFVADTHRSSHEGKVIYALFIEIENHPREEWMPGVVDFRVALFTNPSKQTDIQAVSMVYLLSSIDRAVKEKTPYWFHGEFVMPKDNALYQAGVVYVACRKSIDA